MKETEDGKGNVVMDDELKVLFDMLEDLKKFGLDDEAPFIFKVGKKPEPQRWNQDGIKHKLA